jgi:hypothetical protein
MASHEGVKAPGPVDGMHSPPAFLRLALVNCLVKLTNGLLVSNKSLLVAAELEEQTGGPVPRHFHEQEGHGAFGKALASFG